MEGLLGFLPENSGPVLAAAMLFAGLAIALYPQIAGTGRRSDLKKRMRIDAPPVRVDAAAIAAPARDAAITEKFITKARAFYANSDPENVARIRQRLVQAGYFDAHAVGVFFTIRFAALIASFSMALIFAWFNSGVANVNAWLMAVIAGGFGYFLPNLVLAQKISRKLTEYRNGFPDFMDLMVVCSDAGISMEAAIERVSRELLGTHPSLAQNLQLVTIELRAGRSLDETLRALGDRLGLEEVRAFATLLQQSRELGTSLSGALRVFSDEMRHKRMSKAEEKAHALPAKMSVPVTVCILPVVLLVACIPVIVRLATGNFQ
jgi:tight adherence protein C